MEMGEEQDFRATEGTDASVAGMGAAPDRETGAHPPVSRPPSFGRMTAVFTSDGAAPEGEYLVDVWEDGRVTLAWRERSWHTWGKPIEGRIEGPVVTLSAALQRPKGDRSQATVAAWTGSSTRTTNEPIPSVPYDIENEDAPSEELWMCPLCGEVQPLWFGKPPYACRECHQRPKVKR